MTKQTLSKFWTLARILGLGTLLCALYVSQVHALVDSQARAQAWSDTLSALSVWGQPVDGGGSLLNQISSQQVILPGMQIYHASQNPMLQAWVDQMATDVIQSKTFGSQVCELIGDSPEGFGVELGTSLTASTALRDFCVQQNPKLKGQSFRSPRLQKAISFVFNVPQDFAMESWTTMQNEMFIFFPTVPSVQEIYSRYVHEVVIANDAKAMLGHETFQIILQNEGSTARAGLFSSVDGEAQPALGIVPFPLIKYALATYRSMVAEAMVLDDIFGHQVTQSLPGFQIFRQPMKDGVKTLAHLLKGQQDFLLPFESMVIPRNQRRAYYAALCQTTGECMYLDNDQLINQFIDKLDVDVTIVHENGKKESFFEWLLLPLMDSQQFYARGPKPRIGDGFSVFDGGGNWVNPLSSISQSLNRTPSDSTWKRLLDENQALVTQPITAQPPAAAPTPDEQLQKVLEQYLNSKGGNR